MLSLVSSRRRLVTCGLAREMVWAVLGTRAVPRVGAEPPGPYGMLREELKEILADVLVVVQAVVIAGEPGRSLVF